MQKAVTELLELGRMPDESDDNITSEQIDEYAKLLGAAETPVSPEEAAVLITLFPETALYGGEWALLHKIETALAEMGPDEFEKLFSACPSEEWRETLHMRLKNWRTSHL